MVSNFLKNNLAIFSGNVFFKVGGYIYKFSMVYLLNSTAYGILTVISPFQNILQVFAAGGLPPTVSKFVSQYNATDQKEEAYKIVLVSFKISVFLGIAFGLLAIFFIAPWFAKIYNNSMLLLPFQIIGLIVPFSAIIAVFRGIFQGYYKMEFILYNRAIEQIFMILSAIILVILGFSVVGALFGSLIGFLGSLFSAVFILNRYFKNVFRGMVNLDLDFVEEIKVAFKISSFAVPVILTAISEIGIYSITTAIMPLFISISSIGYFGIAEPIARLPLIISNSLSTTILPVSSEMIATNNHIKLRNYLFSSFRYNLLIMIPICLLLMIFSKEILLGMFFTKPFYSNGASVLSILTLGMFFYSIFTISSSIIQGTNNPKISMYLLMGGFIQILILSFILIPYFGVEGGAIATALTTLTITLISLFYLNKIVSVNFKIKYYLKILFSGLISGIFLLSLPSDMMGFIIGLIFIFPIYFLVLMLLKGYTDDDLYIVTKTEKRIRLKGIVYLVKKIIIKGKT